MQSNAKQCKAKQINAKQCKAKQCNAMQSNATQCKAMQSKAMQSKAKQRNRYMWHLLPSHHKPLKPLHVTPLSSPHPKTQNAFTMFLGKKEIPNWGRAGFIWMKLYELVPEWRVNAILVCPWSVKQTSKIRMWKWCPIGWISSSIASQCCLLKGR